MDHILRPTRLEGSPETTADEWNHWHRTLLNCIEALTEAHPDRPPNELSILINYVSPKVYSLISGCTTFESAISTLQSTFVKPVNTVFARHVLATKKQQVGETIDQFLQTLRNLSKDCKFGAVSASEHEEQAIRDAFISGLMTPAIRQRLLESHELQLDDAVRTARSLEMAQQNAASYASPSLVAQASVQPSESKTSITIEPTEECAASRSRPPSPPARCQFCGRENHPRFKCPARNLDCLSCGKKGHFSNVCRSRTKRKSSAVTSSAFIAAAAPSLGSTRCCIVKAAVNNSDLDVMIDSGSTHNFIKSDVVKSLGLSVLPSNDVVSMASSSLTSTTRGHCVSPIIINGQKYPEVRLSILSDLCTPVILGQEFMKLHRSVEFVFSGSVPSLHVCGSTHMKIEPPALFSNLSEDCHPISTKSRNYSRPDQDFIRAEVQKLLKEGVIEKSNSPWRAQVLVTHNERHKRRMVIDYSATINRFTYLDAFPLPKISDIIRQLSKYKVFTKLDLKSAYYQCPIRENDRKLTAFEADGGLYQFTRLPFGLTNSVAVFQRIMHNAIHDHNLQSTYAYIDDIVIGGENQDELDANLKAFKRMARSLNLQLNDDKCEYNMTKLRFLGHLLENGIVRPDPERLKPLQELPVPTCSKSLKRTLGLFSYYSPWVENFSDRIAPLLNISSFPIATELENRFQAIKEEICDASVAAIEDDVPFTIETDASDAALAASLSQNGRPVAFFSRTLSQPERSHSAVEREAAAIVESVRKWRDLLLGRKFTILTDQQAAAYMFNMSTPNRIKNDKLLRWRLELSNYCYNIAYRPGSLNPAADALSRSCSATCSVSLKDIHAALCHPGIARLHHYVRQKNLPFSMEDIKRICSECQICAELKPKFFKPSPGQLIHSRSPFQRLSIDFVGPKPSVNANRYLLVIIDEYSRYPFAYSCQDMSAKTVIACLRNLFSLFGCPDSMHSDRGAQFVSSELQQFLWQNGVVITHSTPYHPIGNGQCERMNGTLWKSVQLALRTRNLDDRHWQTVLDTALNSIRSLLCTATNSTPHDRLFNFPRRSGTGYTLPDWLLGGPALLRKFVRQSKSDPLVEPVEVISATPNFARIRFPDGRESTVSTGDLTATAPSESLSPTPVPDSPPFTDMDHPLGHVSTPAGALPTQQSSAESPKPPRSIPGQGEYLPNSTMENSPPATCQPAVKDDALKFLPETTRRGRVVTRNWKYQ